MHEVWQKLEEVGGVGDEEDWVEGLLQVHHSHDAHAKQHGGHQEHQDLEGGGEPLHTDIQMFSINMLHA